MAQVYKMKHNPQGTIYSLLTVEEDGRMMMTFHGTDRESSHEVTENADGWLCYPGAMYPGLASGKWQAVDEQAAVVQGSGFRVQGAERVDEQAAVVNPVVQCAERFCREDISQPTPSPRRQRKPRKPLVEHQPSAISHQPSKSNDHAWLQSAGYLAAASVALLIIWQTGLIIPLGLIGLATSGFLK